MANTKYVFQVRGVYQDQEGKYGLVSDDVSTTESLATYLLEFSTKIEEGDPSKYQLLVEELEQSRNTEAKTKQVTLGRFVLDFCLRYLNFILFIILRKMFSMNLHITGEYKQTEIEKTIMLVGATGSGKSTLVDGIVNYVMGVSFEDPFRFSLIQLEKEENKSHNQVL